MILAETRASKRHDIARPQKCPAAASARYADEVRAYFAHFLPRHREQTPRLHLPRNGLAPRHKPRAAAFTI